MYCQCGASVGYVSPDSLNLYPKKSSPLPLLIGMIAGALVFVVIIVLLVMGVTSGKRNITDRTKWEHINGSGYSMTIPGGMKDDSVVEKVGDMSPLMQKRSSEVAIAISAMSYDPKALGSINRKKLEEMIKQRMPAVDGNGHEMTIQDRGSMFYYDYSHEQSGIFFGTDTVHVVDAMCVGKSAIYDVIIICPEKKYSQYEQYIFSWVDSFQGN